jgi:hypothetical protein
MKTKTRTNLKTEYSPSITDFIHGKHDNIQVLQDNPLLDIFPQDLADRVEKAVQHAHENKLQTFYASIMSIILNVMLIANLIFKGAAHDVEKEIDIASVNAGEAVEHDNFCVCSVRFVEEVLLERLLLLDCGKHVLVVVFGQNAVAVIVEDGHPLDGVQGWLLKCN